MNITISWIKETWSWFKFKFQFLESVEQGNYNGAIASVLKIEVQEVTKCMGWSHYILELGCSHYVPKLLNQGNSSNVLTDFLFNMYRVS